VGPDSAMADSDEFGLAGPLVVDDESESPEHLAGAGEDGPPTESRQLCERQIS
jgi:hypothetical protein